ncbi:hypothetical protein V865_007202 [Kwoniella europaea PYCC6329]|uniref:BTB domain-containing protein n=1 Tax=Kwoniella europaea PYCC6329 TaxID=1423913 RepID=A0AAX4KTD4_9TREE
METRRTADSHKPLWHWYHEEGDICLKSTDGVLFKADKWRLSRASEFFQGMLEIASPCPTRTSQSPPHSISDDISPHTQPRSDDRASISSTNTIEDRKQKFDQRSYEHLDLNMHSAILDAFLNLINSSHPCIHCLSFQQSSDLLRQCDKLMCNLEICNAVKQRLYEWGITMPWELLVLASERDDLDMGKVALRNMDSSIFIDGIPSYVSNYRHSRRHPPSPETQIQLQKQRETGPLKFRPFWARIGMLSSSWQIELIKLAFEGPIRKYVSPKEALYLGHTEPQTVMMLLKDWDKVVETFNP